MAEEKGLLAESGSGRRLHTYAYLTGHNLRDAPVKAFAKGCDATIKGPSSSLAGGLSILYGFGEEHKGKLIHCRKNGMPFIHMDHAYFKRGYGQGNFRVCFNFFHQTGLIDVPADRMRPFEEWKKGTHVLLIEPSENICRILGEMDWVRQTEFFLKKHTDRPIRIKKKGPGLMGELKDAHAVVSLSSVAEVEAAVHGVPVFTTEYSPAVQVAERDFTKIETPKYPDREPWLRTLSYSQFHVSEMQNGMAWRILNEHYDLLGTADCSSQLAAPHRPDIPHP